MENGLIIKWNGDKYWYKDDIFHREDGPAVEYVNGTKVWYSHGKLHREDGPAIEYISGHKEWCLNDIRYNYEDFIRLVKLKALW